MTNLCKDCMNWVGSFNSRVPTCVNYIRSVSSACAGYRSKSNPKNKIKTL